VEHATGEALESGLASVLGSPCDRGTVALIVRRPGVDEREVVAEAELDPEWGLVGDRWHEGRRAAGADREPERGRQVTVMNARLAALVAVDLDRRALAGDQLYVDLDLSVGNLPAGARLAIGSAVIAVSEEPHLGCAKFARRFGRAALVFVNSPTGRALRLRGLNARIVIGGKVRVGDPVRKLAAGDQEAG
jgi:MOSC domain-containing protein YiiM